MSLKKRWRSSEECVEVRSFVRCVHDAGPGSCMRAAHRLCSLQQVGQEQHGQQEGPQVVRPHMRLKAVLRLRPAGCKGEAPFSCRLPLWSSGRGNGELPPMVKMPALLISMCSGRCCRCQDCAKSRTDCREARSSSCTCAAHACSSEGRCWASNTVIADRPTAHLQTGGVPIPLPLRQQSLPQPLPALCTPACQHDCRPPRQLSAVRACIIPCAQ
jgi:hypothetical protein